MKQTRLLILFSIGVLILVVILASSFFLVYERTTEKQLLSYGQMTLDSGVLYVDTMMESAKDLLDNISLDVDVSILLNYENVSANSLLTGLRRLYKYEASSFFIDSIYVFNRRNGMVYVSSPHLPEAVYSITDFPDFEATSVFTKYSMLRNMEPLFRTYNAYFPTINAIPYISFVRYNALAKDNESNVIMVNIRQDIFSNLIHGDTNINGGVLLLIDSNGECHVVAGNIAMATSTFRSTIQERLSKGENKFAVKVDGNEYIVCSAKVLGDNATLVLAEDESVIASITNTKGYGNSIILLGLAFVLILTMCVFSLRRIWLSSVAQLEAIKRNEEEKKLLLESSRRGRILSFLHSDFAIDDTDVFSIFPEKATLIVLSIDRYFSKVSSKFEKSAERNNLKSDLVEIFIQCLGKNMVVFSSYEDDDRCVVCVDSSISKEILEKAKAKMENSLELTTTMLIANLSNYESIQETYEYLCQSISYRFLLGFGKTITMTMLKEQEMTSFSVPKASLRHLTEEILQLNLANTITILKEIINEISKCSYRSSQLCLVNISVTLDDAFTRLQTNNGIETYVPGTLIHRITMLESIQDIVPLIETMMKQIEQEILQNKNNRQSELISDIIRITKDNFHRRDFSINIVAEELEMNAAYLGRVFKKATGHTFSEFVLTERMEEACRLLSSTDETIDSIVYSIGFSDIPYFYKLFKKINGCTPVKFRQEHKTA